MKLFATDRAIEITTPIDWKAAVRAGVKILEQRGSATPRLADAIFDATAKFGPYYVLEPGLALAHAEIGPYSLKADVALVFARDEIAFGGGDKHAHVILVLSAPDQSSHIGLIAEFGELFGDDQKKQRLLAAKTLDEFLAVYRSLGT